MIFVRRVRAEESEALRDLRLRALADAPEAFSTTLAQAGRRSEAEWQAAVERGARGTGNPHSWRTTKTGWSGS